MLTIEGNSQLLVDEKRQILDRAAARSGWLVFPHDPDVAAAGLAQSENGTVAVVERVATFDW